MQQSAEVLPALITGNSQHLQRRTNQRVGFRIVADAVEVKAGGQDVALPRLYPTGIGGPARPGRCDRGLFDLRLALLERRLAAWFALPLAAGRRLPLARRPECLARLRLVWPIGHGQRPSNAGR